MFQFCIFWQCIPENRWEHVQAVYHGFLKDPTYKNWHENRPELYKIIDREAKRGGTTQGSVSTDPDINYFNSRSGKAKKGFNKNKKSKSRGVERSQKSSNSNNRQFAKRKNGAKQLSPKLRKYQCKPCSKFAKRPIAHKGPYGGGSDSNCLYNKRGKRRSGYEAINKAEEENEENEDESSNETSDEASDGDEVNAAEEENVGTGDSDEDDDEDDDDDNFLYHVKEGSYLPTFRDANGKAPLGAYE